MPDWIAAIATTGALIAAVVAGAVARKAFNLEKKAGKLRDDERRAEQANRVAAWIAEQDGDASNHPFPRDVCFVLNTSPLPVYDFVLVYMAVGAEGKTKLLGTDTTKLAPPGEEVREIPSRITQDWWPVKEQLPTLAVELRFTDAAGRRWWRAWDGVLSDKGIRERSQSDDD